MRNPEPGADLRPGRALCQGGSHRPGEEFLAQLPGRGELSAIVVAVLPPPILMVDWRHLRDCIGPPAGDEATFARGEVGASATPVKDVSFETGVPLPQW
ncbi:hypothetical protein [Rhodococcus opacus]|uniref:hypothetical protein n=1 Tax=Rhodococcus opacus TaxID=37919 RepID=UPI00294A2763|nr:hypothetical protein [Rhodococcus opacus]MDV6247881.1 hypothetical protein [Rhodococcus opacus]